MDERGAWGWRRGSFPPESMLGPVEIRDRRPRERRGKETLPPHVLQVAYPY